MRTGLFATRKRQATDLIAKLEKAREPIPITRHALPGAYPVDAESFERMQEKLSLLEGIASVEQAIVGSIESLDTMLMTAAEGRIISKVGAEGVWLCGVLPSERHPKGLAIALKVEDGDDRRARPVAAAAILKHLGVIAADALPDLSPMPIKNRRGDTVGRVDAKVEIV